MDSSQLLHLCLLVFSLQEITGVQFKHFPIANGRSESNGPRKFQPRLPAPPTGRPASSNDINPFHLSHLQDEEELGNDAPVQLINRRVNFRNNRPQAGDSRPAPFVIGTTGNTPAVRNQSPNIIDRRPTTIEGFNSRGQPITQSPSAQRLVDNQSTHNRGFPKSQVNIPSRPVSIDINRSNRPVSIEGFDNRGQPVSFTGSTRNAFPRRLTETQRPAVQSVQTVNNRAPLPRRPTETQGPIVHTKKVTNRQRRIKEKNKQDSRQKPDDRKKEFQNRGRLPFKANNRQLGTLKRQRGSTNTNLSKRTRKVAEQRRFNVKQKVQETDFVITKANFNRARGRQASVNIRKVSETEQKRERQNERDQQSQREVKIPREEQISRDIQIFKEEQIPREDKIPRKLQSFQAVPLKTPQKSKQRVRVSEPVEQNEVEVTEDRKSQRTPPKNTVRFPNFEPSNLRTKQTTQNNNIGIKQITEPKRKKEEATRLKQSPIAEDNKEESHTTPHHTTPTPFIQESEEIIIPQSKELEGDSEHVKLVPGVVWLNGKKVWETNFLVRDDEEEPRSVQIELDDSKLMGINIGVAMDKMKTTWKLDPHRQQIKKPDKPKNVIVEIGKPKINNNLHSSVKGNPIVNIADRNQVSIETHPKKVLEIKEQTKDQSLEVEQSIPGSRTDFTNEVQVEQTETQKKPENTNFKAKLPLEKPIIRSSIIKEISINFKSRQPTVSIPKTVIQPTQRSFRNPPIDSSTHAPLRNRKTQASFRDQETQVPFENSSTAPVLRRQPTQPNFQPRPLRFHNPSTQALFENSPTQQPFRNQPQLPIPAKIVRNEIVRSREQIPETNQPDTLAFIPLSFNQQFDDTDSISIDWGR